MLMRVKNDVELEDWILLLVGVLAIFGLVMNGNFTGMMIYRDDFNGPAYSSSGYYGRRVLELRGASSPEGFTAAENCVLENGVQMKIQCCREACSWDTLCAQTCERLVSQQSYQKRIEPEAANIYGSYQ